MNLNTLINLLLFGLIISAFFSINYFNQLGNKPFPKIEGHNNLTTTFRITSACDIPVINCEGVN